MYREAGLLAMTLSEGNFEFWTDRPVIQGARSSLIHINIVSILVIHGHTCHTDIDDDKALKF